jgi:hypothetical protein
MMPDTVAHAEVKEVTVSAVIIRKDGTREDQGVIAHYKSEDVSDGTAKALYRRFKELLNGQQV